MPQDDHETAGMLRASLREQDLTWTVNTALTDEDRIPDLPTGGQLEEDPPPEEPFRRIDPSTDIGDILREVVPSNPWLVHEWAADGLTDLPAEYPTPAEASEEFGAS